jgi:DNA-binding transcriptional LysR family regulator
VRVDGQLTFNSSIAMIDAVSSGLGIGFLPESLVIDDIRAGRLVHVLGDWSPPFPGYFLYYPSRRQNSPAFSVIVNALRLTEH